MNLFKKLTLQVLFIFTKAEFPHNLFSSDCLMMLIMQIENHEKHIKLTLARVSGGANDRNIASK